MKPILLAALLTAFTATASATINCQIVSCKKDVIPNQQHDYCDQFKSFSFELRKNGFLIVVENKFGGISHFDGDYRSLGPQEVYGKSEDLFAKFDIDARVEKGSLVMHTRDTRFVMADFELKCVGTLQ